MLKLLQEFLLDDNKVASFLFFLVLLLANLIGLRCLQLTHYFLPSKLLFHGWRGKSHLTIDNFKLFLYAVVFSHLRVKWARAFTDIEHLLSFNEVDNAGSLDVFPFLSIFFALFLPFLFVCFHFYVGLFNHFRCIVLQICAPLDLFLDKFLLVSVSIAVFLSLSQVFIDVLQLFEIFFFFAQLILLVLQCLFWFLLHPELESFLF